MHSRRIPLHDSQSTRHRHQKRIRSNRHRNEHLASAQLAGGQCAVANQVDAMRFLLPRWQNDPLSAQNAFEMTTPQQHRRERRRDQRFRQQARTQFLRERTELLHAQSRTTMFFGNQQSRPAHFAHLPPDIAIESRLGEPQCADASQIAGARCQSRRAVADHAQALASVFRRRHAFPPSGGQSSREASNRSRRVASSPVALIACPHFSSYVDSSCTPALAFVAMVCFWA